MAKWILTADLQFDEQRRYAKTLPNGLSSRLVDSIKCWEWITEVALEQECQGILCLGDIFDSRTEIDVSVLDQVSRAFSATVAEDLELKVLVGNHDCYLRTPSVNSSQIFLGTADVYDEPVVVGPFAFLPWCDDPKEFLKNLNKLAAKPQAKYLLTHCMVKGAVPAVAHKGFEVADMLPERWQVYLGDVHEPMTLADGKIQYVGAPMHWHYGDAGGERGIFMLDDATGEVEWFENCISPRFHVIKDIYDSNEAAEHAQEADFIRVQCEDFAKAKKVLKVLSKKTPNIENTTVEPPSADEEPRLDLAASDTHTEVLGQYIEYQEIDGDAAEDLLALGLEFVELAQKL